MSDLTQEEKNEALNLIGETAEADLTEEEIVQRLSQLAGTQPTPEEKMNIHSFLQKVILEKDTTKLGYLKDEELGTLTYPLRTYKFIELHLRDVGHANKYADLYKKKAEIITSTSLSRDGKLLDLAVIQRREFGNITKKRKVNSGWFGKKEKPEGGEIE